jgi:hydroxymethylglutaryl-CoA lyase
VGPRDGLQDELPQPVGARIELIDALSATGLRAIEVGSFIRPDLVPAMAGTDRVLAGITRRPGVRFRALVPNVRGADQALEAGVDELELVVSVSETHNARNLNMTVADSVDQIGRIVELASEGHVPVEVIVATAFGCAYQGDVPPVDVAALAGRVRDGGVATFSFADTVGSATPPKVTALIDALEGAGWSAEDIALHFHDTRGAGLANIVVAAQRGVRRFDASIGGLGGCNFSPGATGNVATEDVVHLLDSLGAATGVDLDTLIGIALDVETLIGRRLPGSVMRSGPWSGSPTVPSRST